MPDLKQGNKFILLPSKNDRSKGIVQHGKPKYDNCNYTGVRDRAGGWWLNENEKRVQKGKKQTEAEIERNGNGWGGGKEECRLRKRASVVEGWLRTTDGG